MSKSTVQLTESPRAGSGLHAARLPWRVFGVEALAATGTNLLISAIFFYTTNRFHWILRQNFMLASGQGLFYIAGAMVAGAVARRINRHRALGLVYMAMAVCSVLGYFVGDWPIMVTLLLLTYSFSSTVGWPIMESLVSSDVDSHELSRRVGIYNLIWAAVAALVLAVDGTMIVQWPAGVFLVPALVHAASSMVMLRHSALHKEQAPVAGSAPVKSAHAEPEPELLRVRTLALWLSRVALPATYVAIFSLMALMPSLPVMRQLSPAMQTLLGSIWMATRWLVFLALGLTTWWHTRPRLLLISAIVMLVAFFGVTVRPSDLFGHGSMGIDLATMIAAQLLLGAAVGMIYFGSLYFGMVLSDGSTEHGGYHEALIGVGFLLGPGAGAVAQFIRPGSVYAGIIAVGAVVLLSVIAVVVTGIVGGRRGT